MKKARLVNCGNDFYTKHFDELCEALEKGERVEVYIDCIGHTRNNMGQTAYKRALTEKYGDRLIVTTHEGAYCYSYDYQLEM